MTESIPLQLLQDCVSQRITLNLRSGDVYTGKLEAVNGETMSMMISEAKHVSPQGLARSVASVHIRGNLVKYLVMPDVMAESPVLTKVSAAKKQYEKKRAAMAKAREKTIKHITFMKK